MTGLLLSGPAGAAKPGEPAVTGAGDLDQCGNGRLTAVDDPCDWVNGNLHDTNSHFYESQSVPYRLKLTDLSAGTHTADIGFDVMNSGKHAFDYLTSYDRIAEAVDPCQGLATCSGAPQLVALPAPNGASSGTPSPIPAASFGALPAAERELAAWGVTITSIAYLSQGDLAATNSEGSIRVTFTATGSTGLLAWGGHIASQGDWGIGQSAAGGISGSPYHMRLLSVDGSGGNQDRSLRGAAVLPAEPQQAALTIVKQVVNDHGGAKVAADFRIHLRYANGTDVPGSPRQGNSTNGTSYAGLAPGNYSVAEDPAIGYVATYGGDCAPNGAIRLAAGDDKRCTVTNDDTGALLNVTKRVINDDGGTAGSAAFSLSVGSTPVSSGVPRVFPPGTYAITEVGPPGYLGSFSGDCTSGGSITLANGDTRSCTLTNDDIRPLLNVTKIVINDDGGTAQVSDFALGVGSEPVLSGVPEGFAAGSYVVSESGPAGYAASFSGACDADGRVSLAVGDRKSCILTNDDIEPRLTVIKAFVNDDGGSAVVEDAALFVDGQPVTSGDQNGFDAGDHRVTEEGPDGYAAEFSQDCDSSGNVSLALADVKTCLITNDDIEPILTVTKVVINDNGGDATIADFPLHAGEAPLESGLAAGFDAGQYTVGEQGSSAYAATIGGDCASDGSITLAIGQAYACTITNDDIQPRLTVTKLVVNDDGGEATVGDFALFVGEDSVLSGDEHGFDAGTYTVSERGPQGYAATFSGDCAADGTVELAVGETKECILSNDDIRPLLTVRKTVVNDDGGEASASDWSFWVGGQNVALDVQGNFSAGAYAVTESGPDHYSLSFSGDCDVDGLVHLFIGDVKECLLTNDDIEPQLTIRKVVVNDDGGAASASDWTFWAGDRELGLDARAGFDAGGHVVSESGPAGYALSYSGDCDENGTVDLSIGDEKTCILTNDDIQPILTVTKVVVNDDGGDAEAAGFDLLVGATSVLSGERNGFDASDQPYAVSESGPDGYLGTFSGDCDEEGRVLLALADDKECVLTNDDIQPILTVTKIVVNDNGGLAIVNDTSLFVGEEPVLSDVAEGFDAGSYQVTESGPFGYAPSFSGDCDETGTVELSVGQSKQCFLTNDDVQPILVVTKVVVNDDGGTADVDDFDLLVGQSPVLSGVPAGFDAGTYTVSESGPSGYAASFSGDCDENGTVSLAVGDVKACTLTNDDIQPKLTVRKLVVNDNGGEAQASDWTFWVGDRQLGLDAAASFDAGSYLVSESGPAGYALSLSGDCDETGAIAMAIGEEYECLLTNDDIQPLLTVRKLVVNDNGGEASASDWSFAVDDTAILLDLATGFDVGRYAVSESGPIGYALSFAGDCDEDGMVELAIGEEHECILTNDDIQPILTVTKVVVNDNGGLAIVNDTSLFVGAESVASGLAEGFDAGSYAVSESGPFGYAPAFGGDCDEDGNVSLAVGDVKHCILTNDDIQPILAVTKVVINDDGGAAEVFDFVLSVDEARVSSGVPAGFDAGKYTVSESGPSGYAASFSGDCDENGTVSLAVGDVKACTLTNDDIQPKLTVRKLVVNDNGGEAQASDWTFSVGGAPIELGLATGLDAGRYAIAESGPSGYALSFSGDCDANGTVELAIGQEYDCRLTNDDIQPKLTVTKVVVNDDGGHFTASDWSFTAGGALIDQGVPTGLDAGRYAIAESGPSGYALSYSGDCDETGNVSLVVGDEKECILTNDDIAPILTVTKVVVNDSGGSRPAGDWSLFAGSQAMASGQPARLFAGSYAVTESGPGGYALSYSGDCDASGVIVLRIGESKQCTLTNDDLPAILHVVKRVVNDGTGRGTPSDFRFQVLGTDASPSSFAGAASPGVTVTLDAGAFSVAEAPNATYETFYSAGCAGTLANGEERTCTVTNDDIAPVSRTQGFWGSHTAFTRGIFAGHLNGTMTVGTTAHQKVIDSDAKLFGAFHSDVAKTSTGAKRSAVDQARMVLLQQLVAAKLNCAAFGCTPAAYAKVAQGDAAYAGTSVTAMKAATSVLDAYNNSMDSAPIPAPLGPWNPASPATSKSLANKVFWNAP